jgi:hypothetical protein
MISNNINFFYAKAFVLSQNKALSGNLEFEFLPKESFAAL